MKQEIRDIAQQVAYSTPTVGAAWYTSLSVAEWIAIILGVLQALYLVRKWWREEAEWGMAMRHWAERRGLIKTKPVELDE